jgi:hypothetical protein
MLRPPWRCRSAGLEMLMNSGGEAILDLLEERINNAVTTLTNNIALDCYSDGTADGGRQIGGIQLLVGSNPATGTIGGIDRSTLSAPSSATRNSLVSRMAALRSLRPISRAT